MLIYIMAIANILRTFGIFYEHLVHFVLFWYIFSRFGSIYLQTSGSTAQKFCAIQFKGSAVDDVLQTKVDNRLQRCELTFPDLI
jgi:hypothetical protein